MTTTKVVLRISDVDTRSHGQWLTSVGSTSQLKYSSSCSSLGGERMWEAVRFTTESMLEAVKFEAADVVKSLLTIA